MKKSELIKKVNKISKKFDPSSYSVEAKIFYKKQNLSENSLIITNINENYHLLIEEIDEHYRVYAIKDLNDIFSVNDNLGYIPDFYKSLKMKNIYFAVGKLYSELEKKKIIKMLLEIKNQYLDKVVNEQGLIDLIIEKSNNNYGINAYKEGKKFVFETSNSVMEIINTKEKDKKIYKVYVNNIFIFEFEKFMEAVENSIIEMVKNNIKKISKRSQRDENINLGLRPSLKPDVKEL